uniref:Cyclic nucleotide-binding domain-containing protein n=1 Tax=Macrostomum lignano TaxID=282301 RepID=A0A1I8FMZ1_9PLAT
MENRRVPHQLQRRDCNETAALASLPDKLQAELAIHAHLDTLKRVDMFHNTEEGFLTDLVLRLRPVLFSPGDFVCRKGDVRRLRPRALATLRAGCYFGEISVLSLGRMGSRRTASVRSVGYSQLLCLARADLWAVLEEDHPAARVQLEAIATRRLRRSSKGPLGRSISCSVSSPLSSRVPLPLAGGRVPGEGLVGQLAHRPQLLGQAVPRVWRLRQQPRPQQRRQEGAGKVTAAEQRQLRHKGRHPAGFSELTDGPVHLGQRLLGHRQGARGLSRVVELQAGKIDAESSRLRDFFELLPNRAGLPGELPAQPVAVAGQSQLSAGRVRGAGGRLAGQSDGSKQAGLAVAGRRPTAATGWSGAGAGSHQLTSPLTCRHNGFILQWLQLSIWLNTPVAVAVAAAVAAGRRVAASGQAARQGRCLDRLDGLPWRQAGRQATSARVRLADCWRCSSVSMTTRTAGLFDQLGVQVGRGAGCFGQRHQNL